MRDVPSLSTQDIADPVVRRNFEALRTYFREQNQLLDFKFVEVDFKAAVSQVRVRHGLNVIPRDLLRLEISGPGKLTLHRGQFDDTYMIVSSTDAVHVRMLVGLYKDSGSDQLAADVTEEWKATV
jgi:hypothetical protein